MTIPELFVRERKYIKNVSAKTVSWYEQAFKVWDGCGLDKLSEHSPAELAAALKSRVVELQQAGTCKAISINSWLRVANAYLKWCSEEGYLPKRVKVPKLKEPEVVIEPWPAAEVQKLVQYKPRAWAVRRVQTLALLIADTGLRIGEAVALRRADIDLEGLLVIVRCGKGGKTRQVPISVIGRKYMLRWLASHQHDLAFPTRDGLPLRQRAAARSFRVLCNRVGINGVRRSWHMLRHTFAAAFIRDGGDVFTLQRILGHATLAMTMRYVRLNTTDISEKHARHARLLAGGGK
jgi:integrase/recombinase XerD